jgi:hypothetical protein
MVNIADTEKNEKTQRVAGEDNTGSETGQNSINVIKLPHRFNLHITWKILIENVGIGG